jgi:hypothetical protein
MKRNGKAKSNKTFLEYKGHIPQKMKIGMLKKV